MLFPLIKCFIAPEAVYYVVDTVDNDRLNSPMLINSIVKQFQV